jgi:hypothetical protein
MDHLSVHFMPDRQGGHTWVRVFAGKDADHRACCGTLTFRNEEWELLATHLRALDVAEYDGIIDFEIDTTEDSNDSSG